MEKTVPPLNVSPLIKGARWSFLVFGILYGSSRYSYLKKQEQKRLIELEKARPAIEARKKAEAERKNRETLDYLGKEFGTKFE